MVNNTQTISHQHLKNPLTKSIAQHGDIYKQLHNMIKFTNNGTTQSNSPTIAQHHEIHQQLHNLVKCQQLHIIVKFTNNCTAW